jgi:hypothetical protein
VILQTERLSLTELERSDAPFMLELLTSRGFIDNIGDRGIRGQRLRPVALRGEGGRRDRGHLRLREA